MCLCTSWLLAATAQSSGAEHSAVGSSSEATVLLSREVIDAWRE